MSLGVGMIFKVLKDVSYAHNLSVQAVTQLHEYNLK